MIGPRLSVADVGSRWVRYDASADRAAWRAPRQRVDARPSGYSHGGWVISVALSATRLVTGGSDGQLRVWALPHGSEIARREVGSWIRAVAVSADGERVVCGRADGRVQVVDLDGAASTASTELFACGGAVYAMAVAPNDGDSVVVATGNFVQCWSIRSGAERFRGSCASPVRVLAYSPDGQSIAVGGTDGVVTVVLAANGLALARSRVPFAPRAIAFGGDGDRVVVASSDGRVTTWTDGRREDRAAPNDRVHPVWNVTMSSDATLVASGGADCTARVYDLDGNARAEFDHGAPIRSLVFSADGPALVTGGSDGRARVWELEPVAVGEVR